MVIVVAAEALDGAPRRLVVQGVEAERHHRGEAGAAPLHGTEILDLAIMLLNAHDPISTNEVIEGTIAATMNETEIVIAVMIAMTENKNERKIGTGTRVEVAVRNVM